MCMHVTFMFGSSILLCECTCVCSAFEQSHSFSVQHDIHPAIHVVPHVLTLILSQGATGAQEQVCH